MALLSPYSKIPELNTATVLLVENEEQFQCRLADAVVQREKDNNVNVRLARKLPLPVENGETRPRIDLVVFIVNLLSEQRLQPLLQHHAKVFEIRPHASQLPSLHVVENSLNHLSSDYFLGKVCFVVTSARCGAVCQERLLSVRKLAASHRCPVICAEHQTEDGITMAATRILTILKVSAGLSPMPTTALYLSTLTRCIVPSDFDED